VTVKILLRIFMNKFKILELNLKEISANIVELQQTRRKLVLMKQTRKDILGSL